MKTRSVVALEKATFAARTREIGRLEAEIRMRRKEIDELNKIWLQLVEKEARNVMKARYFGKIVPIQAAIQELELKAVKYHGNILEIQKKLQVLKLAPPNA